MMEGYVFMWLVIGAMSCLFNNYMVKKITKGAELSTPVLISILLQGPILVVAEIAVAIWTTVMVVKAKKEGKEFVPPKFF